MKKKRGYWDIKENCYKEAMKYTSKAEFAEHNKAAYNAAIRNKWIDTYQLSDGRLIYTYDNCYEEAKKYEYLKDFRKNSKGFYEAAQRNGWIKDYHWLKKNVSKGPWLIYAYEDVENKVVYVGLAVDMDNRHSRHKCGTVRKGVRTYDVLAKYWQSIGKPLPRPRIKMEDLDTEEDAQYYEDWYKNKYAELGWRVLNIAPTGIGKSSIGGCNRKWTENTITEVAKKCTSKKEFYEKYNGAAQAANDLKIMDILFPNDKRECSEETRQKISKANKGKKSKLTKAVNMIDINSGTIVKEFSSITEAAIYVGGEKNIGNICACCKGTKEIAKGHKWEYKKVG